jgi:hypothetical protein
MKAIFRFDAVLVIAIMLSMSACASSPSTLGSTSSQNFEESKGRKVSSRACGFMAAGFIPIVINNRFGRAQNALLRAAGDDYVTDVNLMERWTYAVVGVVHCTHLEATAYPRR